MKKKHNGPMIHLGFEVETGEPVSIPILNMAITGQTQESGKTTTLEALASRAAGVRFLTFVTKRGEGAFAGGSGHRVQPYFRDRADWVFVDELISAAMQETNKWLRQFLIPICRTTRTLKEVQRAIRAGMENSTGSKQGAMVQLDAYLELIVPEIERAKLADRLDLRPGLNVMDVSEFTGPMQMLFVQSALDWVNDRERDTIIVVPEAWEFVPQGRGSPVKASARNLVRKGSGIGNRIWLDSQDMAGVEKEIVRGCPVWLIGVQREINEIKRNLANVPAPAGKPKPSDVALLELGQFFVCFGHVLKKVYVQPSWMPAQAAIDIARGDATIGVIKPPVPKPEEKVTPQEADALRAENAEQKRTIADQGQRIAELERLLKKPPATTAAPPAPAPAPPVAEAAPAPVAAAPGNGTLDEGLWQAIRTRALAEAPVLLRLMIGRPEMDITIKRHTVSAEGNSSLGLTAKLVHEDFFAGAGATATAAWNELKRRGFAGASARIYEACDKLTEMGFLTFEGKGAGYRAVPEMKINITEA